MIGTLSISTDVHIFLNIFNVYLIKRIVNFFHKEDFIAVKDFESLFLLFSPVSDYIIKFFFCEEFFEST